MSRGCCALAAGSPADREHALHALYGNIFHQGRRHEATARAVPFLARLAVDSRTPRRDEIMHLLAALAIGYDESYLPAGVDIARWRASIERMRSAGSAQLLRDMDAWAGAATDEAGRRVRDMRRAVCRAART
jgi:hypothetical protein